jgi:hypothetical protein
MPQEHQPPSRAGKSGSFESACAAEKKSTIAETSPADYVLQVEDCIDPAELSME